LAPGATCPASMARPALRLRGCPSAGMASSPLLAGARAPSAAPLPPTCGVRSRRCAAPALGALAAAAAAHPGSGRGAPPSEPGRACAAAAGAAPVPRGPPSAAAAGSGRTLAPGKRAPACSPRCTAGRPSPSARPAAPAASRPAGAGGLCALGSGNAALAWARDGAASPGSGAPLGGQPSVGCWPCAGLSACSVLALPGAAAQLAKPLSGPWWACPQAGAVPWPLPRPAGAQRGHTMRGAMHGAAFTLRRLSSLRAALASRCVGIACTRDTIYSRQERKLRAHTENCVHAHLFAGRRLRARRQRPAGHPDDTLQM